VVKAHLGGYNSILETSEAMSSQLCYLLALCVSIANIVRQLLSQKYFIAAELNHTKRLSQC